MRGSFGECWALGRSFSKGPLALNVQGQNLFGMLTALSESGHMVLLFFMNLGEGIVPARSGLVSSRSTQDRVMEPGWYVLA